MMKTIVYSVEAQRVEDHQSNRKIDPQFKFGFPAQWGSVESSIFIRISKK